ncbi:AAA family ATPase [Desulfotomaculum varum]
MNNLVKIRMWQNLPRPEAAKPVGPVRKTSLTGKQLNSQDKTPVNEEARRKATQEILGELDQLIGLSSVKKLVKEIQAFVEIQKLRQKEKLIYEPMVLHMIFKGNPGTGKTTVARIIGRLFKEMGVLPKGHLIEVERADLVGEYIGHTAAKTRDQIKKALGGILFIDEAYSLARGGEKDFGKEAIDSMVASMENNKDNLIIILAGYQEEMNYFLETNPGLRSRFPIHITFPDYSLEELMEIADLMLKQRQYTLSLPAREELAKILQYQTVRHEHSGNARLVRNLIERAMRHQAVRLVGRKNITREDLMTIHREDLTEAVEEI